MCIFASFGESCVPASTCHADPDYLMLSLENGEPHILGWTGSYFLRNPRSKLSCRAAFGRNAMGPRNVVTAFLAMSDCCCDTCPKLRGASEPREPSALPALARGRKLERTRIPAARDA